MPLAFGLWLALSTLSIGEIILEAEEAHLVGVEIDTTREGYSGAGYVTGFDAPTDSLRFVVDAESGVYAIRAALAMSGRIKPFWLWIDGVASEGFVTGSLSGFAERPLTEAYLTPGTHEIVFRGSFEVDYLRLVRVTYPPPIAPQTALTDPRATPSTWALFRFLKRGYGRRILAGQQSLEDVAYVEQTAGRSPAIGVFDLIEYSPSRVVFYDARDRAVERWIEWAGQDALVSLSWHWNAPTDLINSELQPWWSGFYTRATTFDVEAALADTSSERYQLLLRDIDAIGAELRKLADADVPVLWRPLHEAAGGWFWWGARGPEPFKALWRLLYDRLVHVNDLHNLIWVYTHEPGALAWYPGEDVVDIVSRDVYAPDPRATMLDDWKELREAYGDRHLIALSESGTLPDPDVITAFGIWWSWFSLWTGPYVRDLSPVYLQHVFNHDLVMTREELPDWRAPAVAASQELPASPSGLEVFPNPTSGSATVRTTLAHGGEVTVEVLDVQGRRIRSTTLGYRPAGVVEIRFEAGLAAGAYLVRLSAGERVLQKLLFVTG